MRALLAVFPEATADAITGYAKRVQVWPLLEQAIDQKIEDQEGFVGWETKKVRAYGGDPRSHGRRTGDPWSQGRRNGDPWSHGRRSGDRDDL